MSELVTWAGPDVSAQHLVGLDVPGPYGVVGNLVRTDQRCGYAVPVPRASAGASVAVLLAYVGWRGFPSVAAIIFLSMVRTVGTLFRQPREPCVATKRNRSSPYSADQTQCSGASLASMRGQRDDREIHAAVRA